MKKIGCLILALTFIFVFAACGNNGGTSQTAQTTTSPAQATTTQAASTEPEKTQEKLDPVELSMTYVLMGPTPKDNDLVFAELNKITQGKYNITLKANPISVAGYAQQVRLMLAGQEKMDLLCGGTIGAGFLFDYANQLANGQLYPMNDLLDKYGQGIKESLGEFIDVMSKDGKIYGLPTVRDFAGNPSLAIRKDLVDKYQIDTSKIKTLEDCEAIFKIIKQKEPSMTPYMWGQDARSDSFESMYDVGVGGDQLNDFYGVLMDMQDKSLKLVNVFETPEYKARLELARAWYKAGYVSASTATETETAQALVKAGKVFSFMQNYKPGVDQQVTNQCNQPMVCIPYGQATTYTTSVTGFAWLIPNYAKNPDRSMMVLDLMYSDPQFINLIDWGVEGKHYKKLPDGTIDFADGVTKENSGYFINTGFEFGNQLLSYIWKGDPPDLWKQLGDYNKSSRKSIALGFMFDPSPVKAEYAAVSNTYNQYQRPLESGTVDPAKQLPEFISKMKASGIDKVIAEKQRQLDAWAKSKGIK